MTYGDGVCDVEIDKLIEFHRNHGKLATLTAVKIAQDKGVLDITKDQAVRAFREKNTADGTPINAGYMVLEPQVFDMLEGGDECIFEKTVLVKLAEQCELMSYVHTGFCHCIVTSIDYRHLPRLHISLVNNHFVLTVTIIESNIRAVE